MSENTRKLTININGMKCDGCAQAVAGDLEELDGVISADVKFVTKAAVVRFNPDEVKIENIISVIKQRGYEASLDV